MHLFGGATIGASLVVRVAACSARIEDGRGEQERGEACEGVKRAGEEGALHE